MHTSSKSELFHTFQAGEVAQAILSGHIYKKDVGSNQPSSVKPEERYFGTSFPPDSYQQLRFLVQAKGWDTLLDGVTFKDGDTVLDLGCGDGGNTAWLAKTLLSYDLKCHVIGLDKDPNMCRQALANYPASENPNLTLITGSAEEAGDVVSQHWKSLANGNDEPRVRMVLSNYTLHWVRDPNDPKVFLHEQMFRSLNSIQPIDGEQHHFCAHQDAFKELFEAGYSVIRDNQIWQDYFKVSHNEYSVAGEWRHPPLIDQQGMLAALSSAGYSGTATLHTDERIFPSADLLKDWVKTMIRPFMNRIPDDLKDDFVKTWISHYLDQTSQSPSGSVWLKDRNLLVRATKTSDLKPL